MHAVTPCYTCAPAFEDLTRRYRQLQVEYNKICEIACELKSTNTLLQERAGETISSALNAETVAVIVNDPSPDELIVSNLDKYTKSLLEHLLLLVSAFSLMLSASFRRKERASATHSKWISWAFLYKAFLADVVLRARLPKTVGRTNLLLGAFMILGSLSEPCWRLLQRLRILPSKQYVETWLKSYSKNLRSETSFLIYVFDNCDLKKHVTHVRTEHRTEMIHLINRYIYINSYTVILTKNHTNSHFFLYRYLVEIPVEITLSLEQLWQPVNRVDFGNWLQNNSIAMVGFINTTFTSFTNRLPTLPLKSLYQDQLSNNAHFSDVTFLKPLFDLQTLSYEDILAVVDNFYKTYMEPVGRQFAVTVGDYQVWEKLFLLHVESPEKFKWMIPMPGEWHWTWHIIIAIFRIYYISILLPFATIIGFLSLDPDARNFHYAEDLLQIITIAVHAWIVQCLENNPTLTPVQWLDSIISNQPAYELAYACIFYFIPYWVTRSALKFNKFDDMENWWRYWVHLFHATGKKKYCLMSIRHLMVMKSLHPAVKDILDRSRVVSFSGADGSGIPLDGVCELVSVNFSRTTWM